MKWTIKNAARHYKDWTLYQLATEIDVSVQTVYAWTWGRANPSYQNLEKICCALGCTPNDVMEVELNCVIKH